MKAVKYFRVFLRCYTSPVRKLWLVFFILLLPFQFTWSAAAGYCSHETGATVSHVGHHSHVHNAADVVADAGAPLASGDDLDCGYCHLGCAQPLTRTVSVLSVTQASVYVRPEPSPSSSHVPDWIDRPNWFLAA